MRRRRWGAGRRRARTPRLTAAAAPTGLKRPRAARAGVSPPQASWASPYACRVRSRSRRRRGRETCPHRRHSARHRRAPQLGGVEPRGGVDREALLAARVAVPGEAALGFAEPATDACLLDAVTEVADDLFQASGVGFGCGVGWRGESRGG